LSGNSVQVSLPAVVSITAVGPAAVATAGVAAVAAGFFAGADLAAGDVCDQPVEHTAEITKKIARPVRMESPEAEFRSAGQIGYLPLRGL
jgi:hypothetical protein